MAVDRYTVNLITYQLAVNFSNATPCNLKMLIFSIAVEQVTIDADRKIEVSYKTKA